MENIVCKFGGTSMADGNVISRVKKIVEADAERRYVVVSAPGKRYGADVKITDLLYAAVNAAKDGDVATFEKNYSKISERFIGILKELNCSAEFTEEITADLAEIKNRIVSEKEEDYAASRGEFLAAKIMARLLAVPFVDAVEIIFFNADGTLCEKTYEAVYARLRNVKRAVIPGFYGRGADGRVKTFSRGGGDITGAVIAAGARASLYENWTDVSGFYACDPKIVSSPQRISSLSYAELRELSYMGASVLHSESVFPVRAAGIPIHILNTFRPEEKGTKIVAAHSEKTDGGVVTGIAGKKGFTVITLEKSLMNAEIGFAAKVLTAVAEEGIPLEHMPSGIDTLSVVLESSRLAGGVKERLIEKIKKETHTERVFLHENISLIATVGHGLRGCIGASARLFKALADEGISVITIDQGSSELNIIVGVEDRDCDRAIAAIYRAFFSATA
ncbi:MAG: aspartate kinase [Candidatus Borkfalkiaceae bacterium]|nr:aspartate kinase [Clostridia bacterium]MDY6223000.1 aspartate kinase [Christensenellaceae bacterium]